MTNLAIDNTRKMLGVLDENEIEAVQGVAKAFIMNGAYRPKTEEELFYRIDHSLAQASDGELQDADKAIDDIVKELDI